MISIPRTFLDLDCPCCYCGKLYALTLVIGHIEEAHAVSKSAAEVYVSNWIQDMPVDENYKPLAQCDFHGYYQASGGCPGCDMEEERFEDSYQSWRDKQ